MSENNLKKYVDKFFDELELSEDIKGHNFKEILKANIDIFFKYESSYNAYNIYETFLSIYQITRDYRKNTENIRIMNEANIPLDFIKVMFKYENMSKQRNDDSLIHSVHVFLFGLGVYAQNSNFREIFKENIKNSPYEKYYNIDGDISNEEFLYRWGITSLFQNIAINIETLGKSLRNLINEELNKIINSYGETININLLNLEKLDSINKINHAFGDQYNNIHLDTKFLDLFKPTDILVHELSLNFNLNKRQQNYLKNQMEDLLIDCPCKKYNIADQGLISAIIILDLYGYLIQKYENDPDYFFYPIVDSANAVLLKNFYRNVLQRDPFNLKQLNPNQNPLGFLLILSNELTMYLNSPINVDNQNYEIKLDLEIDDKKLNINYTVKKGRLSIVSEEIEKLLNNVLDIEILFNLGLNTKISIESDNMGLREKKISGLNSPNIPMDLVYKLAKEIHDQYNNVVRDNSSVINIIYRDTSTVIDQVYNNATGQLEGIHLPYMYGDKDVYNICR